jgi:hypothetical protein
MLLCPAGFFGLTAESSLTLHYNEIELMFFVMIPSLVPAAIVRLL